MKATIAAVLLLGCSHASWAQLIGRETLAGCIDVTDVGTMVVAEGRLAEGTFKDYDGTERAFILELPQTTCIDDRGQFADPDERFARVHVSAMNDELFRSLRRAVGRDVFVRGEGFAAHTRHHRAPLVIIANQVTVR